MAVNQQILARGTKGFQHRFQFATPPKVEVASMKVYNIKTFGELIGKNKILIFGSYDLIVCYRGEQTNYEVKKLSKNFCEVLNLEFENEKLNDETEIQVMTYFCREPDTKYHIIMGLDPSIKGLIQNLSGTPHKMVIEVNGEICGEVKEKEKETQKEGLIDRQEFQTDKQLMETINSTMRNTQYKDIKGVKAVDSGQKDLKLKNHTSGSKNHSISMTEEEYNKMLRELKKRYSGG
ncbi:MAG: hypothetical protein PWQ82_642 [Thermosediminibacterales bacterium]|nr:hypothetical protein [Thermosediminibacterales bacterium]